MRFLMVFLFLLSLPLALTAQARDGHPLFADAVLTTTSGSSELTQAVDVLINIPTASVPNNADLPGVTGLQLLPSPTYVSPKNDLIVGYAPGADAQGDFFPIGTIETWLDYTGNPLTFYGLGAAYVRWNGSYGGGVPNPTFKLPRIVPYGTDEAVGLSKPALGFQNE